MSGSDPGILPYELDELLSFDDQSRGESPIHRIRFDLTPLPHGAESGTVTITCIVNVYGKKL